MTRLRFRYTKLGKVRFIGHRDLARSWERALRRSGLPVASTEGFSPRPKVHFGLALSTGFESLGEYLDVDLLDGPVCGDAAAGGAASGGAPAGGVSPDGMGVDTVGSGPGEATGFGKGAELASALSALLPPGIDVEVVAPIGRGTSLQEAVVACDWRIELAEVDPHAVAERVDALLGQPVLELSRERKGREATVEVRSSLEELQILGPVDRAGWASGVAMAGRVGTVAPALKVAELIEYCAPGVADFRVCRLHQWIEGDGARREPLPLATPLAHAGVRAS